VLGPKAAVLQSTSPRLASHRRSAHILACAGPSRARQRSQWKLAWGRERFLTTAAVL